jgi:molybdopterin molybdotransferase
MSTTNPTLHELSCADDYDPNSMPVPRAREVIARFLSPIGTIERVSVRAALGRVLAEDVISPVDVPSHDNSAMDGYALRISDLKADAKVTLKVTGSSFAGVPFQGKVNAGEAVRIMTGGVVPEGADSIVMQEHTESKDGAVTIGGGHKKG